MRERTVVVDGIRTWVRERPGEGTPVVFWHGNPTDADDWLPFMERLQRPSLAADLPGFGRSSGRGSGDFDFSVHAYGRWAASLLDELRIERYSLVIHDWGAVGLIPALAQPERVVSMVAFNSVPFGTRYRWHWLARLVWRRRPAGEIANALTRGPAIGFAVRPARPRFEAMPASFVGRVARNLSRKETQEAILALYRSADPDVLEEIGRDLERFAAPTLLLWAQRDRYIGPEYGRRWAERMPGASLEEVERAGHWSWLDRPELIDRAVEFLS
ncbi:MAG: alpha/beta hydrolase [Actinomycetota bacterium]|nr:alpha/beta hydrolase [Actinomycetota bacterium]